MKGIITTLTMAFLAMGSLLAQDQEDQTKLGTYSAGLRLVHLYDIGAYRFDSELSQDLKGLNGDFTSFNVGVDMYGEKQFTPLLGIQGGFRFGSMNGSNDLEHYENRFHEIYADMIFILSNMDRSQQTSKFNYYAKGGLGAGIYSAERYLNTDGSLNNEIRSSFWEGRLGAGVQYEFTDNIRFEADIAYNMVLNDGFDGYDHASGRDPYLSTGIGVAYTFGKPGDKPMYSVNFFGDEYAGEDNAKIIAKMKATQENTQASYQQEFSQLRSEIDSLINRQSAQIEQLLAQNRDLEMRLKQQEEILAGKQPSEDPEKSEAAIDPREESAALVVSGEESTEEDYSEEEVSEELKSPETAAKSMNTP